VDRGIADIFMPLLQRKFGDQQDEYQREVISDSFSDFAVREKVIGSALLPLIED
jgi:hypothetical protein